MERRIDQLFDFLTPPVPTEELKAQLDSQKASLKHDIRTTILTHINTQADINTNNLKKTTLHEPDREAARTLAERVLRKGYGRKTSKQHLSQWLTADLEVIRQDSTEQTAPAPTSSSSSSSTPTAPTIQTRVASATDSNEDAMDQTQTSRKRRRDSQESPVPVSNRFAILAGEPTVTDEGADPADTDPKKSLTPKPTNKKQNTTNNDGDETADDGTNDTVTEAEFDDAETWSMTSSQCDQLLTSQQPSSSPPDRPNVQRKQNVFVHENQTKSQWRLIIQNSPATVLLTDSNFRLAANIVIPDDWEVHVFPGCALIHTSKLLRSAEIPTCVKNIVLAVGINNRGWNYAKSVKPDWNKMLTQSRQMKAAVHFLGISTVNPCETIKTINDEARKQFGGKFIPALPEDQVTISPSDPYKIHHDKVTVGKIIDSIKIHLN